MFQSYVGTSESGLRAEVESEQALNCGEYLVDMIDAHRYWDLTRPGAQDAVARLEEKCLGSPTGCFSVHAPVGGDARSRCRRGS
ncbi:hypothetical protein DPM19_23395 [Actinomadura craniellae]|uniref:Uncharacterized protein n=1 Tax=Actinomadura craniellae TaxID=2231787 RepID=A0A365H1J1_9ACTN|nr:hypothetical protein DPM19_23395 [Actinomadura craniellae]